jgi:hypothetical protein
MDKNETYTFVFNSINNKQTPSRAVFNVDWNVMPDQPYHVYFSYVGEVNNVNGTQIPTIYVSSLNGFDYKVYNRNQQATSTQTNFLGLLRYDLIGNNSFIYSDFKTNPPVYVSGRPTTSDCIVNISQNAISPTFGGYQPLLNDLGDFILTLLFVPA